MDRGLRVARLCPHASQIRCQTPARQVGRTPCWTTALCAEGRLDRRLTVVPACPRASQTRCQLLVGHAGGTPCSVCVTCPETPPAPGVKMRMGGWIADSLLLHFWPRASQPACQLPLCRSGKRRCVVAFCQTDSQSQIPRREGAGALLSGPAVLGRSERPGPGGGLALNSHVGLVMTPRRSRIGSLGCGL